MENQTGVIRMGRLIPREEKIILRKPVEIEPFKFPWIMAGTLLVVSYFAGSAVASFVHM